MKTIKIKDWREIPNNYTGIIEYGHGIKEWFRNRRLHREDGPAVIQNDGYKEWWLDGKIIWDSSDKFDLKNYIVLSKEQHPKYPTVQVWKFLSKDKVQELVVIPGMESIIQI